MPRPLIAYLMLILGGTACSGMGETAGTLSPLSSSTTTQSTAPPPSSQPVMPHRVWYERHQAAINREATAIRSFVVQLSAVTDPYVLAMTCTKGVELDHETYRAAYEAPDVHPAWIRTVDLTRWMIASCHGNASRSVAEVLPQLDDTLSLVEAWLAGLAEEVALPPRAGGGVGVAVPIPGQQLRRCSGARGQSTSPALC